MSLAVVDLSRARRELAAVERAEVARLLRGAGELRLVHEGGESPFLGVDRSPGERAWRAAARRVLALHELSSASPELPSVWRACWTRELADWTTPRELAIASLLLEDCGEGRYLLGRAELAAGEPHLALRTLTRTHRRGVAPALAWRVLAALSGAAGRVGADALALDALRAAVAEPGCGTGPRCAAFVHALLAGSAVDAERAAAALEAPEPERPPTGHRAGLCEATVALLDARGEPRPFVPRGPGVAGAFRRWSRRESLVGELCRAMTGGAA